MNEKSAIQFLEITDHSYAPNALCNAFNCVIGLANTNALIQFSPEYEILIEVAGIVHFSALIIVRMSE